MHIGDIGCHGMGSEVVVSEWGLDGRPGSGNPQHRVHK